MSTLRNSDVANVMLHRILLITLLLTLLVFLPSCTHQVSTYTAVCSNTFETGETLDSKRAEGRIGTSSAAYFSATTTYVDSTEFGIPVYCTTETNYDKRVVLLIGGLRICPVNRVEFGIDFYSPPAPFAARSNYHGLAKLRLTPTGSPFALSVMSTAGFCEGTSDDEDWANNIINISSKLNYFEFRIPMSYRYPNDRLVFFGPYLMRGEFDVETTGNLYGDHYDGSKTHTLIIPGFSLGVQHKHVAHEITAVRIDGRYAVQYGFILKL